MNLGFHTSSLLLFDEVTAVCEVANQGYRAVASRHRRGGLDPSDKRFDEDWMRVAAAVRRLGLQWVIDSEGRFTQSPSEMRSDAIASEDDSVAQRRINLILQWLGIAVEAGASVITLTSGALGRPAAEPDLERISRRLEVLLDAVPKGVKLALQPMVGDAVATVAEFERLQQWIAHRETLWLAADVGEMLRSGEFPVSARLERNLERLACVFLCEPGATPNRDRRVGQGEVDFQRVVQSLCQSGYEGPVIVRVDGHPELGLKVAQEAIDHIDSEVSMTTRLTR